MLGVCVPARRRLFVLVIIAQEKQREHPENAADGHTDGFALQGGGGGTSDLFIYPFFSTLRSSGFTGMTVFLVGSS